MTEIFAMFKVVPNWCWKLLLVLAALLAVKAHERHAIQVAMDAYQAAEKIANDLLVDKRRDDNRALAAKQLLDSSNIQRKHDEEISSARLAAVRHERMRLGTALCSAAGPAETGSAASGDGANTSSRLVPDDVDRDLRALEVKIETAFAAGRAAQAFIQENGFSP